MNQAGREQTAPPVTVFARPWSDAAACAGLHAVLHAFLLWDVLSGRALLYLQDLLFFVLPYKVEAGRLIAEGHLPIVSSRLGGVPLWMHPSAEILTPATLLYTFLDPYRAHGWSVVLHGTLVGTGVFLIARLVGLPRLPSTWVSIAFACSGPVLSMWTIKAMPTLGLVWLGVSALAARRSMPRLATLSGALGTLASCLHPDPPALLAACAFALAIGFPRRGFRPWLRTLIPGWAAGGLLSGAFLLPMLAYLPESARSLGQGAGGGTVPLARFWEILAPAILGIPGTAGSLEGVTDAANLRPAFITSAFLGVTWLTVLVPSSRRWSRTEKRLLAYSVLAFILSLGTHVPGVGWLWETMHARAPEKLLVPSALGLLLLSASRLARGERSRRWELAALGVVAWTLLVVFSEPLGRMIVSPWQPSPLALEHAAAQLAATAALGALAMGNLVLSLRSGTWRAWPMMIVLAVLDAWWGSQAALPTGPATFLEAQRAPGAGTAVYCCTENNPLAPGPLRMFPDGPGWQAVLEHARRGFLLSPVLTQRSVPLPVDTGGFEPARMRFLTTQWLPALGGSKWAAVLRALGVETAIWATANPPSLAGQVSHDNEGPWSFPVEKLQHASPRIIASTSWESAAAGLPVLEKLVDHPIVIEGDAPTARGTTAPDVTLVSQGDGAVEVAISTQEPALILHRSAFLAGWTAHDNDTRLQVIPANGVHMAVLVSPGDHRIRWEMRPARLAEGLAVSATGFVLLLFLAGRRPRRRA